jgi:uncharacterized membrane protein
MMRHLSWRAIRSHAATGTAAVVCLIGIACADATSPPSALAPRTPSMDRRTPTFEYVTIDVPGAVATALQGINADGDIVGLYVGANGRTHGFMRQNGITTLIDYPAADNTDVRGIGSDGTVVGTYWNVGEEAAASHGYRRTADGTFSRVHDAGHLYEIPQRILPDGTILGCVHDHDRMATMFGAAFRDDEPLEMTDLFASMHNGASPNGRLIVGLYLNMMVTPNRSESYLIDVARGETTTFIVPGSIATSAWDVNPRGDIVGVFRDAALVFHGFVRTDAGFTPIDVPGATATRAFGINARGDVVGSYVLGGVTHGFQAVRVR